MNINVFDVVELNNGNKATILEINKKGYKVEIVDDKGTSLGTFQVDKDSIKKVIFKKYIIKTNIHTKDNK